jgi:hypothetical protein
MTASTGTLPPRSQQAWPKALRSSSVAAKMTTITCPSTSPTGFATAAGKRAVIGPQSREGARGSARGVVLEGTHSTLGRRPLFATWRTARQFGDSHSLRCSNQSQWSSDNRPGPHAIIPSAMAAQVTCTGQPSGTASSTTRVITRSPHAASRVARPRTRRMGKRISAEPTMNAVASGAGNEYGPPGKCNLNCSRKRRTATSFSCRKPSHLLIPDRQNGVRKGDAEHKLAERRLGDQFYNRIHPLNGPPDRAPYFAGDLREHGVSFLRKGPR